MKSAAKLKMNRQGSCRLDRDSRRGKGSMSYLTIVKDGPHGWVVSFSHLSPNFSALDFPDLADAAKVSSVVPAAGASSSSG